MLPPVLNHFLKTCKEAFLHTKVNGKQQGGVLQFVLGNESGDLDSFVSSVVWAWHKAAVSQQSTFVPLMNIDRKDYKLRTETVHLFNRIGIEPSNVLFKDEVEFSSLTQQLSKDFLRLTLVDHHVLSESNSYLNPFVTEIIDHRPVAAQFSDSVDVHIHPVGSCCTLIAEKIFTTVADSSGLPSDVVECLLGTILLDTSNLSPWSGKTTPRDCAIVEKLNGSESKFDATAIYQNLLTARTAIDGFDSTDMILKDPKYFGAAPNQVIASTIHQFLFEFLKRPDCKEAITSYCSQNGCMTWIGMSPQYNYFPEKPFRPIGVYSTNERFSQLLSSHLLSIPDLEMVQLPEDNLLLDGVTVFRMHNCKASRKQIVPIITKCLQEL